MNSLTRRGWIGGASGLPLAGAGCAATRTADINRDLPARADFPDIAGTYLDSGSVHPFSVGGRVAVNAYLQSRSMSESRESYDIGDVEEEVMALFARLINATPAELCFIQSTSAGEQMAVRALGIPESGGRIVTDALHFFGSWRLYNVLESQGMEVVVVRMRDNRIAMADLAAAVNRNTKLVAVSAVSTINGFEHDLKAVTDLAHAHGAHVYVDAVHAVGAVPFDVRASGIDLMASSSYKWLMGDMGLGFMYARADLIPQLKLPQAGYYQVASIQTHLYPFDPPSDHYAETTGRADAQGLFAMGTTAHTVAAHLGYSLNYLTRVGVPAIQAYRQPLLDRARHEIPRLGRGFQPMTPDDCKSAMVAFAYPDARRLSGLLRDAGVRVTLSRNRLRVSCSVFNTMADIDRLLDVLSGAPQA